MKYTIDDMTIYSRYEDGTKEMLSFVWSMIKLLFSYQVLIWAYGTPALWMVGIMVAMYWGYTLTWK